jgi:hypothetical protein
MFCKLKSKTNIVGDFKILIAGGYSINGYTDAVEVIDLETTMSNCTNFPPLPRAASGPTGQFGYKDKPLICGGYSAGIYDKCVDNLFILSVITIIVFLLMSLIGLYYL